MDPWGGSGLSGGAAQSQQWLSTCPGENENRERMDVRLPQKPGGGVGVKPEWNKACLDAGGQEKLCHTLHKSAVLSQVRDDTPEGAQDAGIWPRVLDEAVQPDEHRIPEAGNKRIREELLQIHEQLRVRENDGERAEAR